MDDSVLSRCALITFAFGIGLSVYGFTRGSSVEKVSGPSIVFISLFIMYCDCNPLLDKCKRTHRSEQDEELQQYSNSIGGDGLYRYYERNSVVAASLPLFNWVSTIIDGGVLPTYESLPPQYSCNTTTVSATSVAGTKLYLSTYRIFPQFNYCFC